MRAFQIKPVRFYCLCYASNHFKIDTHIVIDQQYANNIGWASTDNEESVKIKDTVPQILKYRNPFLNESNTEKHTVEQIDREQWKTCKHVGNLLDTQQDITRKGS